MYDVAFIVGLSVAAMVGATISAMLGNAGGALLLGIMLLSGMDPLRAAVPVHAATQLASNATRVVAFRTHVQWKMAGVFAIAAVPGPIVGLELARILDPAAVRILLGCLVIYAAWAPKFGVNRLPIHAAMAIAGFACGVMGVVVGAIGPLLAIFIFREELAKERIVATAAICMAYTHTIKLIAFGVDQGFNMLDHLVLIVPMTAGVIAGTFLGRWIHSKLDEKHYRRLFRIMLTILGVALIVRAIIGDGGGPGSERGGDPTSPTTP